MLIIKEVWSLLQRNPHFLKRILQKLPSLRDFHYRARWHLTRRYLPPKGRRYNGSKLVSQEKAE